MFALILPGVQSLHSRTGEMAVSEVPAVRAEGSAFNLSVNVKAKLRGNPSAGEPERGGSPRLAEH